MDEKEAKAQQTRIKRLATMLSTGLTNPASAIDALIAEMKLGEQRTAMWEGMHAIAAEGGQEAPLAAAYKQLTSGRRFEQLAPAIQSQVLTHAAHFTLGVVGDPAGGERYFMRALEAQPDNSDVFTLLEGRFTARDDKPALLALYGVVGRRPPVPAIKLAGTAANMMAQWPASEPLSDEVCTGLGSLVPASSSLLTSLEKHCEKTGRAALVIGVLERALAVEGISDKVGKDLRQHLLPLYPEKSGDQALPHIRALLEQDPKDTAARDAIRRLTLVPRVGEKLQAMLKEMRRQGHGV